MKNETLTGEPDGLYTPEVGSYTEDKYDLVRLYCHFFSSGMKNKWRGKRTYVDLYAGPGKCQLKGSAKVLLGSPLIALSVPEPFDRYIFCEADPERFASLEERVLNYAGHDVRLVQGSCDEEIDQICALIPRDNLVLCFVDPYDMGFKIEMIRKLAGTARGVDFLFLLAFQMDAARGDNWKHYTNPENSKVDRMLGHTHWRTRWDDAQKAGNFEVKKFLASEFSQTMESFGYLPNPLHRMKQIRTLEKNVPLYYLALFSKNDRAYDFWEKVLKHSTPQRGLFD